MDLVCSECTCVFTPAAACPQCGAEYVEPEPEPDEEEDEDA